MTSRLTAVKNLLIKYYDTCYERDGINRFWSIKKSNEVLNKLKSKGFKASTLSTYDFSTLYMTLPHHLKKDKLIDLIEQCFLVGTHFIWFVTTNVLSSLPMCTKFIIYGLVKTFVRPLLDNIFIRFGTKLYKQIIGIPMGTYCAPLVADLFLFCYERAFMKSLSPENQADIIEAFNSTSRYLDALLNIDNIYSEQMINRIHPAELQLNKANSSDTEAPFLDLKISISNGTVSTKIYDKRDDFDVVNFRFLNGDVPRRTSYGIYITYLRLFVSLDIF